MSLVQPISYYDERAKKSRDETRLVPLVCVEKGKVMTGRACMRNAPARGAVRFTDGSTHEAVSIKRGVEECRRAGEPIGKTDVWLMTELVELDRPTLAIWPVDADVGLIVHRGPSIAPTAEERRQLKLDDRGGGPGATPPQLLQAFEADLDGDGAKERVFSIFQDRPQPSSRTELALFRGGALTVIGRPFARRAVALATVDLAGSGQRQLLVHEPWVNDYGFGVYDARGQSLYAQSCGNI